MILAQDAATLAAAAEELHAGELGSGAMMSISTLAGLIARIAAPLLTASDKTQRLLAIVASGLALALWCWQESIFLRQEPFTLVMSFCQVSLTTLAIFNLTDPSLYQKDNLKDLAHSATLGMVGKKSE